jgi:cytidylate kinase
VAIDGPSGSGKSTVARELARRHGWSLVDTGAMYRALTWWVLHQGVALDDTERIGRLARSLPLELTTTPDAQRVVVDGHDITRDIRGPEVTAAVSAVSAVPMAREVLVERQRELARDGGVVMEGRDIGTVVLPDADMKLFLTADSTERAARRSQQSGEESQAVAESLARRDAYDSTRPSSPLRQAPDALVIDSTSLGVDEVVAAVESALAAASRPATAPGAGAGRASVPLRLTRWIAGLLLRAVLRIEIVGADNIPPGGALIAGNHTGFLDGPLVYIYLRRPPVFLAKSELFAGFWARTLRWARQVPVHRGAPDRAALHGAVATLRAGGLVGMFPEGTRGRGKLETIQDGVGYIATRAGCPVVPVVCRGTAAALPQGRVLPRWRTPVTIVFGAPFSVPRHETPQRAQMRAAAEQIAAELRRLVDRVGLE